MQRIYVHSCGYLRRDPAHEYRWETIEGRRADDEVSEILNEKRFQEYSIAELVQTDSRVPSLVLARSQGSLYLFVSRLASTARRNSQWETLYNSVLLVSDNESDAMKLRILAADVLTSYPVLEEDFKTIEENVTQGILREALDRIISDDEEHGFRLSGRREFLSVIDARLAAMNLYPANQATPFRYRGQLGHNCRNLRLELAYELKHFSFPKSDGALVVVTGIKSPACFQEAYVWRGLSLLAESLHWQRMRPEWRRQRSHDQQERLRQREILVEVHS